MRTKPAPSASGAVVAPRSEAIAPAGAMYLTFQVRAGSTTRAHVEEATSVDTAPTVALAVGLLRDRAAIAVPVTCRVLWLLVVECFRAQFA